MKNKFQIAMTLAVVLAMVLTSLALADQIVNNIDASVDATFEVLSLNTGGPNGSVGLYVVTQSGDGHNGCNFQGSETLVVSIGSSNPSVATVSPSSITFGSCGDVPTLTIMPLAVGSTNITLSQASNNTGDTFTLNTASFTVNVAPPANTPPVVSVTGVVAGDGYEFGTVPAAGCSVTDTEDGPQSVAPVVGSVTGPLASYGLGSQDVTCSYTDSGGLTTTASAMYSIVDTAAPALTVPADFSVEATSALGAAVTFSVAANDAVDPAPAVSCVPASGSTFALDTINVVCSATDAAGNTGSADFNVTVEDTTAPDVTVPSDITTEATGPSGAAVTFSASATDIVNGAVATSCVPASGSIFALGVTNVLCLATDAAGNTGSANFNVTVEDTTPPAVTIPANITAEATGPAGAAVTFSASASDLVDGAITPSCSPASGSTFALGTKIVNCSATDAAGNTGSSSFNVTVEDTTPPTLTLPANTTVSATSAAGTVVTYSASASDLVDGPVAVNCTPASGSMFAPGTTTVNCSATDAAGNIANGSFTVSVKFQLFGFYQPVDMNGVYNIVRNGSTVPLKFDVFAGATELMDTSVVQSFVQTRIACDGSMPADDIEFITTGATSLRYDTTSGQFIQNWQTPRLPGQCYRVTMTTDDGSALVAFFKLK